MMAYRKHKVNFPNFIAPYSFCKAWTILYTDDFNVVGWKIPPKQRKWITTAVASLYAEILWRSRRLPKATVSQLG